MAIDLKRSGWENPDHHQPSTARRPMRWDLEQPEPAAGADYEPEPEMDEFTRLGQIEAVASEFLAGDSMTLAGAIAALAKIQELANG